MAEGQLWAKSAIVEVCLRRVQKLDFLSIPLKETLAPGRKLGHIGNPVGARRHWGSNPATPVYEADPKATRLTLSQHSHKIPRVRLSNFPTFLQEGLCSSRQPCPDEEKSSFQNTGHRTEVHLTLFVLYHHVTQQHWESSLREFK